MANSWFRFKQFMVNQQGSAMKVCTDSCLFGAVVKPEPGAAVLDIGTGSGLLALMMAQHGAGHVDAVEVDADACRQAVENVKASPWAQRIGVYPTSIQDFAVLTLKRYSLVISNPPFFANHLQAASASANTALHSTQLSFTELAACIAGVLMPEGKAAILLPPYQQELFAKEAALYGLHCNYTLQVFAKAGTKHIRDICHYGFECMGQRVESISIYEEDGGYAPVFRELLQPFYLHL